MAPRARRLLDCGAVTPYRRLPWWPALLLALVGLGALYADALRTGFLNDDYLFLEEARARPLGASLTHLGALGNYYRPLSRQLYFAALTPLAGGSPLPFHVVNAAAFAAALALTVDLLLAFLPVHAALAGALYFALLPLQRVNLVWVSCSQDLFALVFSLAAVALFRRGRGGWSCLAYLAALASKEVAFPLPAVLAAWSWCARPPGPDGGQARFAREAIARRLRPFVLTAATWLAVLIVIRARHVSAAAFLHWEPAAFLAAWVHEIQSLIGLDHPPGMARALFEHGPAMVPLVALGALALWVPTTPDPRPTGAQRPILFAVAWCLAFGVPVGPVAHTWSSYYFTLAAVGGALAVGSAFRRLDRWSWLGLTAGLLWWHAAGSGVRAFAIADRPWGWTSHLTSFYFERGAALSDTLRRQLRTFEPAPARGTRFFFAALPPWAGFQMGNGPLIRTMYRDTSLASYFYSQFSDSTAGDRPCRFLYWDGVAFRALYGANAEPLFHVGTDLVLLDRPAGAAHALRRGLATGEVPTDYLYWLGWAELWHGRRAEAEAAWSAFGARDDLPTYEARMREARDALLARDTLRARRRLYEAITSGVGRPEAHGALGELLLSRRLKYALLELKVAAFLNPRDLRARRDLIVGLAEVMIDGPALRELEALAREAPLWASDTAVVRARRELDLRLQTGQTVMEF